MLFFLRMVLTYWYFIRCVRLDDDLEPVFQSLPLISEALRMSVDKMCYMAVFGCRSTLESKVPATARSQFQSFLSSMHKDSESEFVDAWKKWLQDHPGGLDMEGKGEVEIPADASFFGLVDDSDESEREEGGGGAAAPAGEGSASTPTPSTPQQ